MSAPAPGATAPTGTCTDSEEKACTGTACKDGAQPVAKCMSGTFGQCMCKGAAADPGQGAGGQSGGSMQTGGAGGKAGSAGSTSDGTGGKPDKPGTGMDTGDNWLMMGHDPSNQYMNPGEHVLSVDNAKMIMEKWRFTVAGYPTGSPLIVDGVVYALSTAGIYAINLDTGKEVWSRTDIMGQNSLAYEDGFLFVHTTPGANLYKLTAADGKDVWGPVKTYDHTAADGTSSPIVAGGKVFVGHTTIAEITGDNQDIARGGVEAFDTETGDRAWSYYTVPDSGENGAMVWSTVSVDVDSGAVFAGAGNNYTMAGPGSDAIHAINIADGTKKWVNQVRQNDVWVLGGGTGEDTDFGANPILAEVDGKKVVADGDKGSAFWLMDREKGDTLWSRTDLSSSHNAANGGVFNGGAFDGTYFYVVANQPSNASVLHALDPAKMGADAWPAKTFAQTAWGAPSLANGLLLVPVGSELQIYNAKTGDMLTSFETGGTIAAGAAAIAQGRIVVKSGLQYILDATVTDNNQIICYGLP